MKAVIYARYSSDNQREESIDAQVRACREYAVKLNMEVVGEYIDHALSATSDDRPEFLRMVDDSTGAGWSYVIVHKLDRFARNRYDAAIYRKRLRLNGARLVSVLENLDDSPESSILESVLEGMAEYYSRNLSREVKKGLKENALQRRTTGGKPPLGYDLDSDGHYIINEEEAKAVRLIFLWYLRGNGYKSIAQQLADMGIRTKRGSLFSPISVHDIIRNEKYMGLLVYRKYARNEAGKFDRHRRTNILEDQSLISIPGGIPAIVSPEDWEAANSSMDTKSRKGRTKAKRVYLLSGLIFCGECGSSMPANGSTPTGSMYYCGNKKRKQGCTMPAVACHRAEAAVIAALKEHILGQGVLDRLLPKMEEAANKKAAEATLDQQAVRDELQRVDSQVSALADTIVAMGGSPALTQRLKGLEDRKRELLSVLADADLAAKIYSIDAGGLRRLMERDSADLDSDDPEAQARVIRRYVRRVVIFRNGNHRKGRRIDVELVVPSEKENPCSDDSEQGLRWHPQGDSNPCCRRERAVS